MSGHDQDAEPVETPQKKRRRAPKGEMRRTALLDAATEIFARDGYGAASMRDVAAIAGITTVGLLHHFPNKVSLLRALLDRRDQRITDRLGELEVSPTLESLMAFLKLNMAISVQDLHECQAAMMINVESLSNKHPAYPWLKEKYEITHAHARTHLTTLVEKGEIRADIDVKALAIEIFSVMDGLQIQWLKRPEEVNVEATFDSYLHRLAASIRR